MWLMLTLKVDNEQQKIRCLWVAVISSTLCRRAAVGYLGFLQVCSMMCKSVTFVQTAFLTLLVILQIPWMDQWNSSPISSVQSLSRVRLFVTPWIAACQASLSITNSQSPPKPMSIGSVMPSNHLILCLPLLLLPSIFPSITVFSNGSALHIRWPKYWSFSSASVPSMNTQDWSHLGWIGWISLQSKGLSRVFSNTTVQKHQFFGAQLYL